MISKYLQVRFGTLAVEKSIITPRQLGKAINIQMNEDLKGIKHRRLGEILVGLEYMTHKQVEEVLEAMSDID